MSRSIVAVASDFQSGSSLGLADPRTLLSRWGDDGEYQIPISLNPAQQYLYDIYRSGIAKIVALAGKDPVHLIINGDMTQGDKFFDELSYPLLADQVQIATDLILTFLDMCKNVKSVRLTKSTRVHAYSENQADMMVAKNVRERNENTRVVSHGQTLVDGALVDYAHHGPPGGVRSWLKGNLMRFYVKSAVDTAIKDNRQVPAAILRAHKHERVEEWVVDWRVDERLKTVGITTPSFQMMTTHAQKVTNSEPKVTNGMVALELVDGAVKDVHWFAQTRYLPQLEEM